MKIPLTRQQIDTIIELLEKVQKSDDFRKERDVSFALNGTPVPVSGSIAKDGVSIQWAFKGDNDKVKSAIKAFQKYAKGKEPKFVSWKLREPINMARQQQYDNDKCITLEIK